MGEASTTLFSPRLAFRVWQRELTLYRRIWKSTMLSQVFDPIIYLVAMGFGLGAYLSEGFDGVSYAQFIAPGLVASAIMLGATYEVAWNSFMRIFVERSYEAMLATPASLEDVVAGELAWAATRAAFACVVMLVVLAAFGLVRSAWALLVPLVAGVGGLAFAAIGLAYTTRVRHMDHLTFYFTLFLTPMYLFSGVFFPLDRLPPAVQAVALASPLYHLVEAARDLVIGSVTAATAFHVLFLAGLAAVAFGVPARTLRRRLLV